ncbi:PF06013 domain protein [Actinomadura rubteroloni]|uniref:PF06013 domain protein n=1 Tax=Actinomadura rubteroloni TaxID=1926885 RepID=A0A2P4UP57_9ACTN|nr:WXG100 family type VII secretion target [Actinomadura rubteroloni]POM26822.1 PF06013 domain protein [Actinomadura rubteroloni]
MGQAFSTSHGAMQQAESMFEAKHKEMVKVLDDLESDLKNGLAKWEDAARDAYFEARDAWERIAREQAATVKEFAAVVGFSRGNYQTADKVNTEMWA